MAYPTHSVAFEGVEVVKSRGLMLMCRVGDKLVAVPPLRTMRGTTISQTGDRGTLVIPREVALNLGLI
jgi:hypothetical protein